MKKGPERQKFKICFISLNARPLLKERNLGYVGGAEVQQVGLAKELVKKGHEISFITYGKDRDKIEKINGIKILSTYGRDEVNKLNFLRKMLIIWKKMKEIDADVYYYRVGSPGIVSFFGILANKFIINSIASDAEITGETIIKNNAYLSPLEKFLIWIDIKLSNITISQNNFQKAKLKERFKVESVIIRNGLELPSQNNINHSDDNILWVGTIRSVKQPHLFLKIAKYFPEYKFIMIGGKGENLELFETIKKSSYKIPNVEFKGFVSRNEIFDYYKKASLLINTSKTEGFPNVFLEAWIHHIPIISLNIDPDEIISKYKLGYHSKSFEKMMEDIRRLVQDETLRKKMGNNGRKYVEENHDIKKMADQYEIQIMNYYHK